MSRITILCGIPCSRKSTWASTQEDEIISRDHIRLLWFGKDYKQNKRSEEAITNRFNYLIDNNLKFGFNVILDNTFCREKYIDEIINKYPEQIIKIKFFEVSLWKAHFRNIKRYLQTGKYIPIKIINNMYRNFNKINRKKYAKYIL